MNLTDSIATHFQRFQMFVMNRMVPSSVLEKDSLSYWRVRILFAIIFTGLLISPFVLVPVIAMTIEHKLWGLLTFDVAAWLIGIGLLLAPHPRYEIRAVITLLMFYVIGLGIIISVGLLSGGPVWLFAFAVLVGVLLGSKAAIAALMVNALTLTIISWMINTGLFGQAFPFFNSIENMITAGASFITLNTIAAMSVAVLVKGLISAHQKERDLTGSLKRERSRLIAIKNELESEVAERKRAEEALREGERRLTTFYDVAFEGIVIIDQGRFVDVNNRFCELFGYNREELIGSEVMNLIAEEDRDLVLKNIQSDYNKPYEHRAVHKNGSELTVEVHGQQTEYRGRLVRATTIHDITERKQAEEALQKSETKYRLLAENASDVIWTMDMDLNYTYISPAIEKLHGWNAEEAASLTIDDVLTPQSMEIAIKRLDTHLASGAAKGDYNISDRFELELYNKDGTTIWTEILVSSILGENGELVGILGITRDISERKTLEDQLLQAQKMEAIGTLAGGIAHDFNNILSIIVGNTELALDDVPEWNSAHQNLKDARKACLRARDVVKQILAFSRQIHQEKKPIQIAPIITESLKLLRSSIPATIEIRQNVSSESDTVSADATQINQVLLNLCTNAAHAMKENGGVLEINLDNTPIDKNGDGIYHDLPLGKYLRLMINDTGSGIEPEIIGRVFDPYFTTKDVGKGSGMGLAVVHGIVTNHGGLITADSEPGKGSSFQVILPTVEMDPEPEIKTASTLSMGSEHILFVDDEEAIVELSEQMLQRLGYKVTARMSSLEALETFRNNPDIFDLVITDQTMPDMTGVELIKALLKIRPEIPIILCTGFSEMIDDEKAKEMGIQSFALKPVAIRDLAGTIRQVLDKE